MTILVRKGVLSSTFLTVVPVGRGGCGASSSGSVAGISLLALLLVALYNYGRKCGPQPSFGG